MCCAASFSMVSASSWSLIEGSEIFFTITECPLTAVATAFDLISLSVNNFEIAVETVPESTIMESTTISGAKGSSPRWATSIPSRPRFSSTALMLEDPTSRPTILFAPNPNMCPPLRLPGSFHGCLLLLLASGFHLVRLIFHPLIKLRLLEAPAVAQLEGGDFLFPDVLVQRVRTHSQVLRSLANVHHFPRVGHSFNPFPQNEALLPRFVARPTRQTWEKIPRRDRKSTRLNSSHSQISYAVFCLKKKNDHAALTPPSPRSIHPTTPVDDATPRLTHAKQRHVHVSERATRFAASPILESIVICADL